MQMVDQSVELVQRLGLEVPVELELLLLQLFRLNQKQLVGKKPNLVTRVMNQLDVLYLTFYQLSLSQLVLEIQLVQKIQLDLMILMNQFVLMIQKIQLKNNKNSNRFKIQFPIPILHFYYD